MPNVRQLKSIVDYNIRSFTIMSDPALPTSNHFTNFQPEEYWISHTDASNPNVVITVNFSRSGSAGNIKNSGDVLVFTLPARDSG